jgi:hypothetical protein
VELNEILLYWFLFVSASALVGSFVGTLLALGTRALYKKIKKWMDN